MRQAKRRQVEEQNGDQNLVPGEGRGGRVGRKPKLA